MFWTDISVCNIFFLQKGKGICGLLIQSLNILEHKQYVGVEMSLE